MRAQLTERPPQGGACTRSSAMANRSPPGTAVPQLPAPPGGARGGSAPTKDGALTERGGTGKSRRNWIEPKEPQVLKFPQFEWYLGPMYERYRQIQVEKALASRVVEIKKRAPSEVASILPHEKHTKPRPKCYKFSNLWGCEGENEGIRDCGWYKRSSDMEGMHLGSDRKVKHSTPRRGSAVPSAWHYDIQRWPNEGRR